MYDCRKNTRTNVPFAHAREASQRGGVGGFICDIIEGTCGFGMGNVRRTLMASSLVGSERMRPQPKSEANKKPTT